MFEGDRNNALQRLNPLSIKALRVTGIIALTTKLLECNCLPTWDEVTCHLKNAKRE